MCVSLLYCHRRTPSVTKCASPAFSYFFAACFRPSSHEIGPSSPCSGCLHSNVCSLPKTSGGAIIKTQRQTDRPRASTSAPVVNTRVNKISTVQNRAAVSLSAADLELGRSSAVRTKARGPAAPHISRKRRKLQLGLLSEQKEDARGGYVLLSGSSVAQPVKSLRFPLSQQEVGLFFLVKTSTRLHKDAERSRSLLLAVSTRLPHRSLRFGT